MSIIEKHIDLAIQWIRSTTDVESGRGALVPVSGGSDSALAFWLCTQALPKDRTIGVYIGENLRCEDWFEDLGVIRYLALPEQHGHPEAQRWALLLCQSLEVRGWLVGTRNRTEDILGTFSLASRVATYLPLAGFWKTEVMAMAAHVGVPKPILQSSRRADPSCGRPATMASIPFETIDRYLQIRIGERSEAERAEIPDPTLEYLDSVYERNQFKQQLPLQGPRGTSRGT